VNSLQEIDDAATPGARSVETSSNRDEFTDTIQAERLAGELRSRFRWSAGLGWMAWDGKRWESCTDVRVIDAARLYYKDWYRREPDQDRADKIHRLLSRARQTAIIAHAKGPLEVDAADFDRHPDLLNTPSGVVDLRTGQLQPHDPELLLTKMTGAEFVPGAKHADWDKALEAIPADVRAWVQVRLGQAATGYMSPDDTMLVSQGGGANGKTTVYGTIAAALGDYYTLVSDRVLLANPDAHPTELMDLRGARFALIEETPEARRLDVARLKKVVGTPEIKARRIRQDPVQFGATHTLFVNTNYRPMVGETDHGTWRRLLLLDFPYRFGKPGELLDGPNDRPGDPTLTTRCRRPEVQSAVLRWLVDGARVWYAEDRIMPAVPQRIEHDTRAWRMESDQILAYFSERLVPDRGRHIMTQDLYEDFRAWLSGHGQQHWGEKTLTQRFGGHEEVQRHHVEKRRLRRNEKLSRPEASGWPLPTVTAQYMAWLGVRFATADDLVGGEQRGTLVELGKREGVQGVQADPGNSHESLRMGEPETPCTPCTTPAEQGKHGSGTAGTADPGNSHEALRMGEPETAVPAVPTSRGGALSEAERAEVLRKVMDPTPVPLAGSARSEATA
jgi:putative DNA primase/helicase